MLADPEYPELLKDQLRWYWEQVVSVPLTHTAGAKIEEADGGHGEKALRRIDLERIIKSRLLEKVDMRKKRPLGGGLRLFTEAERLKGRKRIIRHTKVVNDATGRIPAEHAVPFATAEELHDMVLHKAGASCFDIAAFYDALELPSSAREAHIVAVRGVLYRLTTIPTGQRHSVGLAQLVSAWIAEAHIKKNVNVWIDNIRVVCVAPQAEHEAQVKRVYQRAAQFGLAFNETFESVRVPAKKYEFIGAAYDHDVGAVAVGTKTCKKLSASWTAVQKHIAGTASLSIRQMAAHFGILFYAASVCRPDLSNYFSAMRFFRELAALPAAGHQWDDVSPRLPPGAAAELERWTLDAIANTPRKILTQEERASLALPPTHIIVTDASVWGWGSLCVCLRTGSVDIRNGAWEKADGGPNYGHSTEAEPEGVYRALCAHVPLAAPWRVCVYTDHEAIVHTQERGYSRGFNINMLHSRVQQWQANISFRFVAGKMNPADAASRGNISGAEIADSKRQALALAHGVAYVM
jgi:hypothetical protein